MSCIVGGPKLFYFFFYTWHIYIEIKPLLFHHLNACTHTNPLSGRCAAKGVDLDVNGVGDCDYPCPGDDSLICGGYLGFTAYDIGKPRPRVR